MPGLPGELASNLTCVDYRVVGPRRQRRVAGFCPLGEGFAPIVAICLGVPVAQSVSPMS
jgi:hypothetical protein